MPVLDSLPPSLALDKELTRIITAAPLMPLNAAGADKATLAALESWLKGQPRITPSCVAGLWLLAGDLHRSHTISQSLEDVDGSYWHGIMHRREGDYFNAKYWMRRTGGHPVTAHLKSLVPEYVDALAFVDYVQQAVEAPNQRPTAERIQWIEWQLLFAHCF